MNALRIGIVLGFMAAPAFGQSFDLPRLIWPTETKNPAAEGCADPMQLGVAVECPGK